MSDPVAYAALGTKLYIGDAGSPETFFLVARAQDISGPKKKRDTIDVTTQDTDDGYRDFISSLKDGQEITLPLVFDPNTQSHGMAPTIVGTQAGGIDYLFENGARRNMKLVMPTSPSVRFSFIGLVTGVEYDFKVLGAIMANVTIKVAKRPTLELGA